MFDKQTPKVSPDQAKPEPTVAAVMMAVIDAHTKQMVSMMNFLEARDQLLMKFHGIGYSRLLKEAGLARGMEIESQPEPMVPYGATMPEMTGGLPSNEIPADEIDEETMTMRFPVETNPGSRLTDF